MTDEELHNVVRHLAKLHGVSPEEIVAEVTDQDVPEDEEPESADEAAPVEAAAAPRRRGRAHWTAWTSAMVVMGVMVGLVIVGAIKFLNDPAQADMSPKSAVEPASPSAAPKTGTSALVGPVVSFSYPGQFDAVAAVKSESQSLEAYTLASKSDYHHLITVDVRPLESGDLDNSSDYKVRIDDPTDYHETTAKIKGDDTVLMTKADGSEQTMFWVHEADVLTVAVTSSEATDNIPAMMNVIKDSVRWTK